MTTICFYGGINEIGGNKVLLEDKDTRVWFDFGQSFKSGEDYFTEWLGPRTATGAKDYFEFNLLPKLPGLYSRDALRFTDLKYQEPEFDAVFLSHCHFDHIAHIQFVDERIPVYLGEVTKKIVDAWQTSSTNDFGEHDYRTFKTGKRVKVGSIEVEPVHVDHSVPAAYGFIAHTSEGAVVYTGDLRMHGPKADMTLEFIERARKARPIALVCEGTRVAPKERSLYSEEGVRLESNKVISGTKKLVVATFYGRDVDRMRTFSSVARDTNRQFVVSTKAALLLDSLKGDMEVPKLGEDFIVYAKRKKSGEFGEEDYYKWERPFVKDAVNFEYIQGHQSEVLLNLDFYDFAELVDIRPSPRGHFIHSMSEPFSEEDLEAEVMQNWLKHFKLRFHQIHASGHCSRAEIGAIVRGVGPRKLFPVHTEHPELFRRLAGKVYDEIELGKAYEI